MDPPDPSFAVCHALTAFLRVFMLSPVLLRMSLAIFAWALRNAATFSLLPPSTTFSSSGRSASSMPDSVCAWPSCFLRSAASSALLLLLRST